MFKKKEEQIRSVFDKMLQENSRFSTGYQKQNIQEIWNTVLGPTIARYTSTIRLDRGTLYVKISSAALRNELIYEQEKLLLKLNEHLVHKQVSKLVIQ